MPSQKVILDLDDFSIIAKDEFEQLQELREHYPNMKVSMFTIPAPAEMTRGLVQEDAHDHFMKAIKEYDWLEFCPHGVSHLQNEALAPMNRKQAKEYIKLSELLFKKQNIPFQKIFKAPFWQANELVYTALKRRGYTVAVDRNNIPAGKFKKYIYNWSIDEPELPKAEIIRAHGHIDGKSKNTIKNALENFKDLIEPDAEFLFISEYLSKYGKN